MTLIVMVLEMVIIYSHHNYHHLPDNHHCHHSHRDDDYNTCGGHIRSGTRTIILQSAHFIVVIVVINIHTDVAITVFCVALNIRSDKFNTDHDVDAIINHLSKLGTKKVIVHCMYDMFSHCTFPYRDSCFLYDNHIISYHGKLLISYRCNCNSLK